MRFNTLLVALTVTSLISNSYGNENALRRIEAHLRLSDGVSAAGEAFQWVDREPESAAPYEYLIKSLALSGDEEGMMVCWGNYKKLFPEKAFEKDILEPMCWGILEKGARAPSFSTKLTAMIGAAITQDIKGVKALLRGLNDSNVQVRAVAVELASLYGDDPLKQEFKRLFHKERSIDVRKLLFKGIAKLELVDTLPELMGLLSKNTVTLGEKKEIIKTLAHLKKDVTRDQLLSLVSSRQAVLKILACECILDGMLKKEAHLLQSLLNDSQPDVKVAALYTLGFLRIPVCDDVYKALSHHHPLVRITAAWNLLLDGKKEGEDVLTDLLSHEKREIRLQAAGVLATSGTYGVTCMQRGFTQQSDPYVKANLALGLLRQRVDTEAACRYLDQFLRENQDQWMWGEGLFSVLQKSTLVHKPSVPNYPEAMNQKVRLEILNLLAILEYPGTQELIRNFLQKRHISITSLAAEVLLGEGDEASLDLIRNLLDDPNPEIAVEAALVLGVLGKDESAIPTLIQKYPQADRSLKIKILEALGRVGSLQTVPFLVEQLKDPSQILRIISACVLIQTLNH